MSQNLSSGVKIDAQFSFFLKYAIGDSLINKVYLENEELEFEFSFFEVKWKEIVENIVFRNADFQEKSHFFDKFSIDLNEDGVAMNKFLTLDELIESIKEYKEVDRNFDLGYIKIGECVEPIHSNLLYAYSEQDFGSIWLELSEESFLVKLAPSIISLLQVGEVVYNDTNIKRFGYTLENLHKKWDSIFWVPR